MIDGHFERRLNSSSTPDFLTGKDRLQGEACVLICAMLGVSILTFNATRRHYAAWKSNCDALCRKTNRELRVIIERVSKRVEAARRELGFTASARQLADVALRCTGQPDGESWYMHKSQIDTLWPTFDTHVEPQGVFIPNHARVELSDGRDLDEERGVTWFTPEAALYSELGALSNLLVRDFSKVEKGERERHRAMSGLCRSLLPMSLYFVEAYLNGLAADYLCAHASTLDEAARNCLQGRDPKKPQRLLKTREKLLKFQLVLTGQQPLQENNCPEMAYVLQVLKAQRDATVHAAAWALEDETARKEELFLAATAEDCNLAVDNVVGLARKYEEAVRGHLRYVPWLQPRGKDGLFPAEALT